MHVVLVLTNELIHNISKFERTVYVLNLAKYVFRPHCSKITKREKISGHFQSNMVFSIILDIVAGYDSYVDVYCPVLLLTCCDTCKTCVFIVGTGYMKMQIIL